MMNDRTDDRIKSDNDRMNDRTTESPIVELLQQELTKNEKQLTKKDEQIEKFSLKDQFNRGDLYGKEHYLK